MHARHVDVDQCDVELLTREEIQRGRGVRRQRDRAHRRRQIDAGELSQNWVVVDDENAGLLVEDVPPLLLGVGHVNAHLPFVRQLSGNFFNCTLERAVNFYSDS
jgi:hypothetical protein